MLFHRILHIWIFAYTAGSTDKQRRRWQPKCKYIKQKRPTTVWYCLAEKNNANASLGNTMFIVCSRQNYCYREFGRYIGQQNLITCGISNSGCLCIDATNTSFFCCKTNRQAWRHCYWIVDKHSRDTVRSKSGFEPRV